MPLDRSTARPLDRSSARPLARSSARPLVRSSARPLVRSSARPLARSTSRHDSGIFRAHTDQGRKGRHSMLGWLTRRGKLSGAAERRLMVAMAKAQERVIRTHVHNALSIMEAVAGEMKPGRALQMYLDDLEVDEPEATIIAKRVKARLEEEDLLGDDDD
jgi:hypothetical protein